MYGSSSVFALIIAMLPPIDVPIQVARPFPIDFSQPSLILTVPIQPAVRSTPIDFSDLQPFERVRSQYQAWGIEFEGAIALQPSNSAFNLPEASVGLIPCSDRRPIKLYLQRPYQEIGACLIGAKQITVKAFGANQQLVHQQCFGQTNYLQAQGAASRTVILHNMQLSDSAIVQLEISSDASFMLKNLRLS